jgi:hypothetical protein
MKTTIEVAGKLMRLKENNADYWKMYFLGM